MAAVYVMYFTSSPCASACPSPFKPFTEITWSNRLTRNSMEGFMSMLISAMGVK